jgi:glutamine synthetase
MHTHLSLFTGGRNAFFDADDSYFLSDVGKAFIAGQLRHARELSSIFAQWVNSYKRLVRATRRRSTSRGAGATGPRSSASRPTTRAGSRPPGWSCAARTPRATRT